jgi:hypothetical protein
LSWDKWTISKRCSPTGMLFHDSREPASQSVAVGPMNSDHTSSTYRSLNHHRSPGWAEIGTRFGIDCCARPSMALSRRPTS